MVFCVWSSGAQEFRFTEKPMDVMLKEALVAGKPVFAMVYASWCPHCHKMKQDVLPQQEVTQALSPFLVYGFDAESAEGKKFMKKYRIKSFPGFAFVSADGELLYAFSGEMSPEKFVKEVTDASDPNRQLPTLKAAFSGDMANPDKCLAYLYALRKADHPTQETASLYFYHVPDDQLVSAMNWKIFANGITRLDSREFQHVLANQQAYAAVSSQKRVDRKVEHILYEALKSGAESASEDLYQPQRKLAAETRLPVADSLLFVYDRMYFQKRNDWKGYQEATLSKTATYGAENLQVLKTTAQVYLDHIDDAAGLEAAIDWAKTAQEKQPSKDAYLLTARLQKKAGKIAQARESAQKAVDLCNQLGFDPKDAQNFLNELSSR